MLNEIKEMTNEEVIYELRLVLREIAKMGSASSPEDFEWRDALLTETLHRMK